MNIGDMMAVKPSTEEKSSTEKKVINSEIIKYIKENFKCKKGETLDMRFLWGKFYRLNFWSQKIIDTNKGETNIIVRSFFISVEKNKDGFVHEDLTSKKDKK